MPLSFMKCSKPYQLSDLPRPQQQVEHQDRPLTAHCHLSDYEDQSPYPWDSANACLQQMELLEKCVMLSAGSRLIMDWKKAKAWEKACGRRPLHDVEAVLVP